MRFVFTAKSALFVRRKSSYKPRRDARVAEEARLESVYASKAHPGFESPSLRKEERNKIK